MSPEREKFEGAAKEVWATIKAWNEAYEKGEEKFFDFFDKDADFFTLSTGTRIDSVEDFKKIFAPSLKSKVHRKCTLLSPEIKVFDGHTAIATEHARINVGGQTYNVRQTQVFKKTDKGWKIIHLHNSPIEVKPAKPDEFLGIKEFDDRIAVAAAASGTPK